MLALTSAFVTASLGNVAVVLAASETAGGSAVAPWLQGGGSAAAVAGLVYVARMIVKGDLVPRAVADRENETAAAIRVAAAHAAELQVITGEALARETTLAQIAGESVRGLADVNAELRWWRDQRERGHTVSLAQPPRTGDRE
jgi:hypothetical protein